MACKPAIEPLEGAFAEREGRVLRVLDLRHRSAADPGEDTQLRAVELTMRKLRAEEQQGGDCCSPVHRPPLFPSAASVVEQIASQSAISRSGDGAALDIRMIPFDGPTVCSAEQVGNGPPIATSPESGHGKRSSRGRTAASHLCKKPLLTAT